MFSNVFGFLDQFCPVTFEIPIHYSKYRRYILKLQMKLNGLYYFYTAKSGAIYSSVLMITMIYLDNYKMLSRPFSQIFFFFFHKCIITISSIKSQVGVTIIVFIILCVNSLLWYLTSNTPIIGIIQLLNFI